MKNISAVLAWAILALAAHSCMTGEMTSPGFEVRATISDVETKLGYDILPEGIAPSWSVGDEIFGYDDNGVKFTFRVSSVSGRTAQVDVGGYTPGNAKLVYAVFCPGKDVSDIADGSLPLDLSVQSGKMDGSFPMVMTATGHIRDGRVSLAFRPCTAVLGILQLKVAPGVKLSKLVVSGVLATGEVNSIHGNMGFVESGAASEVEISCNLEADSQGLVSQPLYVSVLPEDGAEIGIRAYSDSGEEYAVDQILKSCDISAGHYYYVAKRMSKAVAGISETGESFTSIHSAIERANSSKVPVKVVLYDDVTVQDSIIVQNENCAMTIDFNGHRVTGSLKGAPILRVKSDLVLEDSSDAGDGGIVNTYANVSSRAIYVLWNYQNLTINGGQYESKADTGVLYYRGIGANLVINGGKFINNRASGGSAVYVYGSTNIKGTINGGTFVCNNGGSGNAVRSANKAQIVINNGYFHNGTSTGQSVGQASTAGITGNVFGGYFNKELPAEYIAAGHTGKSVSVTHDGLTYSYSVE